MARVDTESSFFRLLIVGGLVLLVLIGLALCAGFVFFFGSMFAPRVDRTAERDADQQAVKKAAEDFLKDLRAGNAEGAYQKTSRNYQGKRPAGDFQGFVAQQQAWMKDYKDMSLNVEGLAGQGNTYACQAKYTSTDGDTAAITMDLLKEGGGWKVDSIQVDK